MNDSLLRAIDVAELIGLSTGTVLDWFEAGKLPGFKVGRAVRFRESEILAFLEAGRRGPDPSSFPSGISYGISSGVTSGTLGKGRE